MVEFCQVEIKESGTRRLRQIAVLHRRIKTKREERHPRRTNNRCDRRFPLLRTFPVASPPRETSELIGFRCRRSPAIGKTSLVIRQINHTCLMHLPPVSIHISVCSSLNVQTTPPSSPPPKKASYEHFLLLSLPLLLARFSGKKSGSMIKRNY